jgi:hypothetical protein
MQVGVIVLELVVVPRHQPRERGVGRLQVGIRSVLRVPGPVVVQREQLPLGDVLAHVLDPVGASSLVDVVAEVHDQLDVVLKRQVGVGRVIAVRVVLTRDEREAERGRTRAHERRRPGPPDRADLRAPLKAVPVLRARLQPRDLRVHRVDLRGQRLHRIAAHDLAELRVRRELIAHPVCLVLEVAVLLQRRGRQARPQHDPVRRRVTRRNAQTERVAREGRRRPCRDRPAEQDEPRRRRAAGPQQGAPADPSVPVAGEADAALTFHRSSFEVLRALRGRSP